ncbi:MAG TPA: hypothetical protein VFW86_00565 [Candidatus Limnocylindrales bacterium]|nr:hypothetical protein [Candidatus Limnocylindrales bacterium]
MSTILAALSALVALVMAIGLIDQWRDRHRGYQLLWAIGILLFGIAAACEAAGAAVGWNDLLFRAWYLAGAVLNVAWLGLGTAYLLGRTRFGYSYAAGLALGGMLTIASQAAHDYPDVGPLPAVYLAAALVLALAIGVATYFEDDRWPILAAIGVIAATLAGTILVAVAAFPSTIALDPHGVPVLDPLPGALRLLTPLTNVSGALSLFLGALFSAYVFMPKRRVLGYSLDGRQSGDVFLFNLLIAPVAITVNFLASLPGAVRDLFGGRLHSRVPATILIALGAIFISGTDLGVKGGATTIFELSKLLGVVLMFGGFLVSTETFRELRIPFTDRRFGSPRVDVETAPPAGESR